MLHSLDARRGRLLTNSLYTQTSGAELHALVGSLHEGSSARLTQPSIGEVPTASLESCRFVSRWSSFASPIAPYQSVRSRLASNPQNHIPSANPARASWLQSMRPVRRVAELGSLGAALMPQQMPVVRQLAWGQLIPQALAIVS